MQPTKAVGGLRLNIDARHLSEIICYYQRPSFGLCSFLCLIQRSFPLLLGIVLCLGLRKDAIGDFEVAMRWASVAGCVPGTIKLLRCWGFADRAKERSGHLSTLVWARRLYHRPVRM